jgi:hypothetical protein
LRFLACILFFVVLQAKAVFDMDSTSSSRNEGHHAASSAASIPLPDPDHGFVLSPNDPNHPTNFVKPGHVDKSAVKKGVEEEPEYILGTLIVRVVAAKNLKLPQGNGGLFGNNNSNVNPYASVRFGKSTQRSSEVFGVKDPVWPRQEAMFMDVALPESKVTHPKIEQPPEEEHGMTTASASFHDPNNTVDKDPYNGYQRPTNTLLTVALFHTQEIGRNLYNFGGLLTGDSDDVFLGVASMDLTRLFTGKVSTMDKWLPLQGTACSSHQNSNNSKTATAVVRVSCEYEPSDVPPKHGDICRFTSFCHPKDLYPLEPGRSYKVEQVLPNDVVLLSYESQEGWVLSFQAHRNMLICEERHVSMLDSAQDELHTFQERLAYSPLVATVTETAERVADDGLVGVAEEIAKGGFSLFDRWIKGGVDTVIGDLQHVTNFDGRHNPATSPLELSSPTMGLAPLLTQDGPRHPEQEEVEEDPGPYLIEDDNYEEEEEANPYMPPCPITGFPMSEPVVAADGHSYEKAAILRWFQYSDKSPMTGAVLAHKELVPNYGLMSSVQEAVERERNSKIAAAAAAPIPGLKHPPPGSATSEEVRVSTVISETENDACILVEEAPAADKSEDVTSVLGSTSAVASLGAAPMEEAVKSKDGDVPLNPVPKDSTDQGDGIAADSAAVCTESEAHVL